MHTVALSRDAQRFFEKAGANLQRRLDRAFKHIAANPRSHPNIKPLKGKFAGSWRFRVGDLRIVYQIHDNQNVALVSNIEHRKDVYE